MKRTTRIQPKTQKSRKFKAELAGRRILSVMLCFALLLSLGAVGVLRLVTKAADGSQGQTHYVDELVTNKTVTATETPGVYNVKLEAYTTAAQIQYKPTDIIMVLDLSGSMDDELRKDQYQNLNTHTTLSQKAFSSVTYNDLFDNSNEHNGGDWAHISTDYEYNKYIEDPNRPGTYVYVACRYEGSGFLGAHQKYTLYFTDSFGNEYESDTKEGNLIGITRASSFTFHLKTRVSPADVTIQTEPFTLSSFYFRNDDDFKDNCLNKTLYNKRDNLWIKDDNNVWCKVTLDYSDTAPANYEGNYYGSTYIYSFTDSNGVTHTSVQGNHELGGDYGLFQGFKTYKRENGSLDVVHSYDDDSPADYSIESRSLYYKLPSASSSVTRLQAMKEAVEQFIIDVHSNAHLRDIDQRIGIVTFNNGASTSVDLTDVRNEISMNSIIDKVYRYEANNATQIDEGMKIARNMFSANSAGRNKVVVAFTDGVPTVRNGSNYSVDAATNAISYANQICDMTDNGTTTATAYSIGLFGLADPNQMHGSAFYHSGTFHDTTYCTGEVGSTWGRTNIAGFTNDDMSDIAAAANNRFLNLLSSNYEDASNVGIEKMGWFETYAGEGYRITQNFTKTGSNFYFGAHDSEELYGAFKSIAEDVSIPENTLGLETSLVDIITDSFTLNSAVSAYTEACDSTGNNWSRADTLTANVSGNKVTVDGFNYSENFISAPSTNTAGNYGKKLIVEFQIKTIDNFVGGNQVPTNGADSAVYGSDGIMVEDFQVPQKDISLNYALDAPDQEIFLNGHGDLVQMMNIPSYLDGKTNQYVDISYSVKDSSDNVIFTYTIPAGKAGTDGTINLTEYDKARLYPVLKDNAEYTVSCTVDPINEGAVATGSYEDSATIYVYKPYVTVSDQTLLYETAQNPGANLSADSIVWKAEGKEDSKAQNAEGAPTVSYQIKNTTDNIVPATPMEAYVLADTKDFRIYDFTIEENSFTYDTEFECYLLKSGDYVPVSSWTEADGERTEATDSGGNIIYETDENGNPTTTPVYVTSIQPSTITVDVAALNDDDATDGGFVTYFNSTDNSKTNGGTEGNFTVYVNQYYTLKIQKRFTGDYAVPEDVTFTVTDSDGETVGTLIFDDETDFAVLDNGVKSLDSGEKTLSDNSQAPIQLDCSKAFTISETFTSDKDYAASYTFSISGAGVTITDNDATDFAVEVPGGITTNGQELKLVVTNDDHTELSPMTGKLAGSDSNIEFIVRVVLVVTAAAGAIYLIFFKRKLRVQ